LPKGACWNLGPDPAGRPEDFVPDSESHVFDIVEWRWDEIISIAASDKSAETAAGFSIVFGLSDGSKTDAVEVWADGGRRGPVLKARNEWTIRPGHPTRELVLVSHGDATTGVLRRLEQCFGYEPLAHPALPEKTAVMCEMLMLRGIVAPKEGRFTARMKVVMHEDSGWPYAEFCLNVNSALKKIWVSEKSADYRIAILERFSHLDAA
jgi:hypothetical protein